MATFGTTQRAAVANRRPQGTIRRPPGAARHSPVGSNSRHVKVVLIGDGAVGKTSLLTRYASNEFNPKHEPTIFENCSLDRVIDGRKVELALWDNAGQEEFDKIRLLSYSSIDVFIAVFSINNWDAFQHVKTKWIPEITEYAHGVPLILVGSKCDLRRVPGTQTSSYEAGVSLAQEIDAVTYMECSAKTSEGCTSVFEQAVREALASQDLRRAKSGKQKHNTMKRNMTQRCCVLC